MPRLFAIVASIHLLMPTLQASPQKRADQLDGYLGVPMERVEGDYGGGFSMYVAAWPLQEEPPGPRFQTGLFGTWMFAELGELKPEERVYSDIEGGLGWWRDTRFPTETPKFIMGGVALNFSAWANGPGAGKGRDWAKPQGKYGVAQLSPWLLWPPDGLNLKRGTSGELLGYGYLPLPLTEPKSKTGGVDVPTGNQCWTLFLNAKNFKGPVAFFTPYFFSRATMERPEFAGLFLDTLPSDPNRQLQMETQHVPATIIEHAKRGKFARVNPTRFPVDADGESVLVHRVTSYARAALWDSVDAWFKGGEAASGEVLAEESKVHTFTGKGWSSWRISTKGQAKEDRVKVAWESFAKPKVQDSHTFSYVWDKDIVGTPRPKKGAPSLIVLPEYFAFDADAKDVDPKDARWIPTPKGKVPGGRKLGRVDLVVRDRPSPDPYVTPEDGDWATPGPVKGPFKATLDDGSALTYSWYRFADQPALLNADLTPKEREALQLRVEKLHAAWNRDREYLPPPTVGTLAELDAALIVEPPAGLEVGYVPIVTRQGLE